MAQANAQDSNIKQLSATEFRQQLNSTPKALILDVRPSEKYKVNRIQEAMLVETIAELKLQIQIYPKDQPLFVYCQIEDRSGTACQILKELGYTQIFELKGGLQTWIEKGYELDRSVLLP